MEVKIQIKNQLRLLKKYQKAIMEVILHGPKQQKKEIKYGKLGIMYIIQLKHKETI